jgi:uncharacterized protein YjaZ
MPIERIDALAAQREALRRAWAAPRPGERGVAIEPVAFALVLTAPRPGDEDGDSGFGAIPGRAMTTVWPSARNLPRLPAATAHELHHNVCFSVEPWPDPNGVPVGQYMVAEGLAEAFAAELFGQEMLGRWATRASAQPHRATMRSSSRTRIVSPKASSVRSTSASVWAADTAPPV